jgi:hypothetical protein
LISWALIAAVALVLLLPIAWRIGQRRFDPFEPLVLFTLAWGAMFVARPVSMLVGEERSFVGLDVMPTFRSALLLALVGAAGFVAGYEMRAGRRLAQRLPAPRSVDVRVATVGALVVVGLGLVALMLILPAAEGIDALRALFAGRNANDGLLQPSSSYISHASVLLAPAAFVLVGVALRERSPGLAIIAALTLALALARVVPGGARMVLLPLLGGIFVLVYVMRTTRPRAPLLAVLVLLALLGSYFTLQLRDPTDDVTLRTGVEQLLHRPQAVLDPVLNGSDAEMVLALSAALTVVPDELGHRWGGATIGNLVTRPVPREIWSRKPRPPGETVVATVWPDLSGVDPAFSPLLVLYWDFGLVGVVLGMALFGLLARLFYEWFLVHRHAFGAQLLFSTGVWLVVIAARNDPVDTIALGAFLVGPVVAIVAIASEGLVPALFSSRRFRSEQVERRAAGERGETQ